MIRVEEEAIFVQGHFTALNRPCISLKWFFAIALSCFPLLLVPIRDEAHTEGGGGDNTALFHFVYK